MLTQLHRAFVGIQMPLFKWQTKVVISLFEKGHLVARFGQFMNDMEEPLRIFYQEVEETCRAYSAAERSYTEHRGATQQALLKFFEAMKSATK